MQASGHRRWFGGLVAAVVTTALFGCAAPTEEDTDDGSAAQTAANAPRKRHLFIIRTKGFIAPITSGTVGSLGGTVADAALSAFSSLTNAQFSEDPKDGSSTSGQYRLWAEVELDVKCVGNAVELELLNPKTDAGFEGPLRARFP